MYIRTDGQKKAKQLQYPSIDTYALQLELISLSLLNISSIYRNLFCIYGWAHAGRKVFVSCPL